MDRNNVIMLQALHMTQISKYQQHKFGRQYINQLGNRSVEGEWQPTFVREDISVTKGIYVEQIVIRNDLCMS